MDRDSLYKQHILDAVEKIQGYTAGVEFDHFINNSLLIDGVVRQLQVIGEAAKRLSSGFKDSHSEIPWDQVMGMRDKIIHDYADIQLKIVWDAIKDDLPQLDQALKK